jgi:hypothetical protein
MRAASARGAATRGSVTGEEIDVRNALGKAALVVACVACAIASFSGAALGFEADPDVTTAVVARESSVGYLYERAERVEVGLDEAVVVLDIEGRNHAIAVDYSEIWGQVRRDLADDGLDPVDLAAIPMVGASLLRIAGLLLRVART